MTSDLWLVTASSEWRWWLVNSELGHDTGDYRNALRGDVGASAEKAEGIVLALAELFANLAHAQRGFSIGCREKTNASAG